MSPHPAVGEAPTLESPDVVVVGAGPAGLGAAAVLARAGLAVVVLERGTVAGGYPRYCGHSPFGMREFRRVLGGPRYADRLADVAARAGASVRLRHAVVALEAGPRLTVASPDGTVLFAPRRVLLATGIREASRAARLVGGTRPLGVLTTGALQDYVYRRRLPPPFKRPLVVGTELVSMSALLTCRTAGVRPVAVVEAGREPVIRRPLHLLPRLLGIPLMLGTELVAIHGASQVEGVTLRTGAAETPLACDGVVFTGGFVPEASLARAAGLAIDPRTGGPAVDDHGATSLPGVFAAGNLLRGVETAGWCWAEGCTVAAAMLDSLHAAASAAPGIPVQAGPNVKLVMPQRLAGAAGRLDALQVRLDDVVRGTLVVRSGGRVLWSRPLRGRPERRIMIPTAAFRGSAGDGPLEVAVLTNGEE